MPTHLFLISGSLRAEAERLFYGKNHFVLLPPEADPNFLVLKHNAPPSLYAFIHAIPPHCVRRLGSIEVVFPGLDEEYFAQGFLPEVRSSAWWWRCGLQLLLLHHTLLPRLSLTLDLSS